jgi:hypothetical protein
MTEYVVKLRFWLRCWDSMTIDADNDADAIAMAPGDRPRADAFSGLSGIDRSR